MKQMCKYLLFSLLFCNICTAQVVQKYGSILHYPYTWHRFDEILNTTVPAGFDYTNATVLIKGESGNGFSTFLLDVGDHNGTNTGVNPFRVIIFNLDSNSISNNTSYIAVDVRDPQGNLITGTLGRCDGKAVFGPNGKIYTVTYGLGKYLIEFDQENFSAIAYPVPPGLSELFIVNAGPQPDATNPTTLLYGGTFNSSQVWWFDPSSANPEIKFIEFEIDPRQNYINQVAGRGDWIYAKMVNRSLAGDAYRSLYAVNIKTKTKYLLFHSTKSNFNIATYKDKQRPGENNVFISLNGKSPGTIYPNPTPILMSTPPPAGVGANCPCYNVDVYGQFWKFPVNTRLNYFKVPFYNANELTGYAPEFTSYQYNQNFAWDVNKTQPFVKPPLANGLYICNPNIDNGAFANFPWDFLKKFTRLPNSAYNYYFRLNGENVDIINPIEDGNHSWENWNSYDPFLNAPNKPKTSWDGQQTLTYQFPGKQLQTKTVGLFSATGKINDLKDYDADLSGLSMTTASGKGWVNGAATLVKGDKKEGFAVLKCVPVSTANPLGYTHEVYGQKINETDDILALGENFSGNNLATHMISGYPGDVQLFTYGKPIQYTSNCKSPVTGITTCNPRLISKMYPLELILPNGNTQYGPQTSVGARLYSTSYYQSANNVFDYKVVVAGAAGRARQGLYSTIGIHKFQFNDTLGSIIPVANAYKVIDRLNYSYFDNYTPICMTNEAAPMSCIKLQASTYGFINSPYNEGKGYYVPANNITCKPTNLRMLLCVRSLDPTIKKNQLWIFNPTTERIISTLDFPDPELNYLPIEYLKTISDFYIGKTTGCNSSGNCVKTIFLFRIKNGVIDSSSIVKFKDTRISNLISFTVTENTDDFRGNGKIFKVFFSYYDNVNKAQLASVDIIAANGRSKLSFGPMFLYQNPDNVAVRDFAYVPKQGVSLTDLIMVGGKNLYVLKNVVPVKNYDTIAKRENKQIDKIENTSLVTVYPNPFNNEIFVNTSEIAIGNYNLKLLDNTGKLIFEMKMNVSSNHSIEKILLPYTMSKGIYIFQMVGNEISTTIKLMKQ